MFTKKTPKKLSGQQHRLAEDFWELQADGHLEELDNAVFASLKQNLQSKFVEKAVHEVVLDDGSWEVAHLFLPCGDPLLPETHAGEQAEMEAASRWFKGIKDLRTRLTAAREEAAWTDPHGGGGGGQPPSAKGAGKLSKAERKKLEQERKAAAAAAAPP